MSDVYVQTVHLEVRVLTGDVPWEDVAEAVRVKVSRLRGLEILGVEIDQPGDALEDSPDLPIEPVGP